MSSRTLFLSRLIGLYFLVCGLAMIVHKQVFTDALAALPNPFAMLCITLVTVLAGLAMVLAHNMWAKRPAVVIVTLIGWLTLVEGILYLLLPAKWLNEFSQGAFLCRPCIYSLAAFWLVLGAYLTYEGFRSKPA